MRWLWFGKSKAAPKVAPVNDSRYTEDLLKQAWLPHQGNIVKEEIRSPGWFDVARFSPAVDPEIVHDFDPESTTPTGVTKTRLVKYKLKTSKQRMVIIQEAMNLCDWVYNKCVELCCHPKKINEDDPDPKAPRHPKIPVNATTLSRLLINQGMLKRSPSIDDRVYISVDLRQQLLTMPYPVLFSPISDFVSAVNIQRKLRENDQHHVFDMKFRSKKQINQQSFTLVKERIGINDVGAESKVKSTGPITHFKCFPKIWGKVDQFNFSPNHRPASITHDCRLVLHKSGKLYLHVPTDVPVATTNANRLPVATIDPGVRVPFNVYDLTGNIFQFGGNENHLKIARLAQIAENLRNGIVRRYPQLICSISKYWNDDGSKIKFDRNRLQREYYRLPSNKGTPSMMKAAARYDKKVRNLVDDLHRKTASFLCNNYRAVIIPKFETKQMVKKYKGGVFTRKIGRQTSQQIIRWSHYRFQQLLIAKGEVTNTKIIVGTEEYTSKTCGNCRKVHESLGPNKKFVCPHGCGYRADRDDNGAYNILLLNWFRL